MPPFLFIDDSGAPPPPPTELVVDDFNPSSGSLNGTTPAPTNTPGNNWAAGSSWSFTGAGEVSTSLNAVAFVDVEQDNYEIEAEFKGASGSFWAILVRAQNDNTSGANAYIYLGGYIGGGYEVGFFNFSDFPWYTDGSATIPADTYFTAKAVLNGSAITLFINGTQVYTGTQTYRTTGPRVGMMGDLLSAPLYCRKFTVRPL